MGISTNLQSPHLQSQGLPGLDAVISETTAALKRRQRPDGHWVFDLEADATIPSEFIMLNHYLDEREDEVEAKLAVYIRSILGEHGGWRSDPRARWRGESKRLHPLCPGAVWRNAVAGGAGDAGGTHAGAEMVPSDGLSVLLLVAHGDRTAADPRGAQAARQES